MRRDGGQGGLGGPFGPSASGRAWPPVPCLWPGETVAILASGPSLTGEQAEKVRGKARVIAINNSWQLAPWADALYACDWGWWNKYRPAFEGLRISQDPRAEAEIEGIVRVPSVDASGLSLDPAKLHTGGNSGYQAINLAVLLGARRILLLGYDMAVRDGSRHWHGDHPDGLNNPGEDNFARWRAAFATTLPDLARAGVEVLNCTPGSALTCFPMVRLEDVA